MEVAHGETVATKALVPKYDRVLYISTRVWVLRMVIFSVLYAKKLKKCKNLMQNQAKKFPAV